MKALVGTLVCVILVLGLYVTTEAAVPGQINVQGRLTDSGGIPLAPGSKTFAFKIYNDSTGGIAIWPLGAIAGEEQTLTTGQDGLWTALLGAIYPLSSAVFADSVRWLEIVVQNGANPSVIMPRVRLVTGPYAYRVATVDEATGGDVYGSLRIGTANTSSGNDVFVAGRDNGAGGDQASIAGGHDNIATGEGAFIGGGYFNQADGEVAFVGAGHHNIAGSFEATIAGGKYNQAGDAAFVGGGLSNRALGVQSAVGGGHGNAASNIGAVVMGGFWNKARGDYSVVCGGGGFDDIDSNQALGNASCIGGGSRNIAAAEGSAIVGGALNYTSGFRAFIGGGDVDSAMGRWSTIAGGSLNVTNSDFSTVGGGKLNRATGISSTIGGGYENDALGTDATVAGGYGNIASGYRSVVGGGGSNYARGDRSVVCGGGGNENDSNSAWGRLSFIGGGHGNVAGDDYAVVSGGDSNRAMDYGAVVSGGYRCTASSTLSTIGGGQENVASGTWSTITGGAGNSATKTAATVCGGEMNAARGEHSLAAGCFARANHRGTFVWGDNSLTRDSVWSDTTNQFKIHAQNGVRIDHPAGSAKIIRTGDRYRDNAVCAWAKVRGSDGVTSGYDFGVASVVRNGAGNYTITVDVSASNAAALVPVVSLETDTPPTSATAARLIYMNQVNVNVFDVYVTNGNYVAADNDFVFLATAR